MDNPDNKKTLIYVLVAGMALLVAWEPWDTTTIEHNVRPEVGTKVFKELTDPLAAKSLEIIKFDEDTATIRPFKVAQVNGVWSIPSHSNYPADAKDHMAEAATALIDLEVLGVASTSPGDQELYGVITPDPQKLRQGMTGVGTRVTLRDGKDKVLADLVIGKTIKEQPAQRYVRRADQDPIYTVKIKTDRLSTKFEDWIEKDLLKLNAFDVRNVGLSDYSIEEVPSPQGGLSLRMRPRSRMKLSYDDSKSNWKLDDMSEYGPDGKPTAATLGDDEELNSEKLNALKTALDDLQIVDVERKPKGLSQDLRASEEFQKDAEAQASLVSRGFYPVPVNNQIEMYSSEGEATCTTKDGVSYVLRFGRLAGGVDDKDEKAEGEKPKTDPALNRYLFVMAQFDESQIAKPQLEEVPGGESADKADEKEKPAADSKQDADKPEAKKGEAVPEKKTADDETKDEKPAADAPAEKKATPPTAEEEKKLTIERENKRKMDEYNDAVKKGQEKVKELNDRFADWYFIISDDVYKKVHLGRGDIVKKKDATKEGGDPIDTLNPEEKDLGKGLKGK